MNLYSQDIIKNDFHFSVGRMFFKAGLQYRHDLSGRSLDIFWYVFAAI